MPFVRSAGLVFRFLMDTLSHLQRVTLGAPRPQTRARVVTTLDPYLAKQLL